MYRVCLLLNNPFQIISLNLKLIQTDMHNLTFATYKNTIVHVPININSGEIIASVMPWDPFVQNHIQHGIVLS